MSKVDTRAEAVERLAKRIKRDIDWRPGSLCADTAVTLRALLAERDAAAADARVAGDAAAHFREAHAQAAREVERLTAEVAAREAAAAMLMQKRCQGAACMVSFDAANRIAALPLPAADALARALEQARAEEREACAKTALRTMLPDDCGPDEAHGRFQQAVACCEAIRARGKEPQHDR